MNCKRELDQIRFVICSTLYNRALWLLALIEHIKIDNAQTGPSIVLIHGDLCFKEDLLEGNYNSRMTRDISSDYKRVHCPPEVSCHNSFTDEVLGFIEKLLSNYFILRI